MRHRPRPGAPGTARSTIDGASPTGVESASYDHSRRERVAFLGGAVSAISRSDSEQGAAVLEMAVVASILMTILLGIVTFGLTHYQNIAVEGAAREAARFAATYPVDDAGSLEQWLRDVARVAEGAAIGVLDPSDSRVVCVAQGSGADPLDFMKIEVTGTASVATATEQVGWCYENDAPGADPIVQVHLERAGWIETIVFSMRPTLTGEATNRFERAET